MNQYRLGYMKLLMCKDGQYVRFEKSWERWLPADPHLHSVAIRQCMRVIPPRKLGSTSFGARCRTRRFTVNGRRLRFDRSFQRLTYFCMEDEKLGLLESDIPRWFHLSPTQIQDIIDAPGLPLQGSDEYSRGSAESEISRLLFALQLVGIEPPSYPKKSSARPHAARLAKAACALEALLFDGMTDKIWDGPRSQLAHTRETFRELCDWAEGRSEGSSLDTRVVAEVFESFMAEPAQPRRRGPRQIATLPRPPVAGVRPPSPLETFISGALNAAFEHIYGRAARRSRAADGSLYGPFIHFAHRFFEVIGHPVAHETIARALAPRLRRTQFRRSPAVKRPHLHIVEPSGAEKRKDSLLSESTSGDRARQSFQLPKNERGAAK